MNSLPRHCAYLHLKYEWKSVCYDWVFIINHDYWPVQKIQCVSQCRRPPSSPLVVKLFEFLRWVGVCIWCSVVLHTPSLLQQQSTQPTILPWWYAQLFLLPVTLWNEVKQEPTLVILHILSSSCCSCCVLLQDVVVHQRRPSKQTETSWTAQHRAEHMLCGLLQPMAHCVFKLLVPNHGTYDMQGK